MAELWMRRVQGALWPDSDESIAEFETLPIDKALRCVVTEPRNAKHLRLYWVMCARIAEWLASAGRDDIDRELVDEFFKRHTGHHHPPYTTKSGEVMIVTKSISFAKMDQIAFREFFEKCVRFAYVEWGIPNEILAPLLAPDKEEA